MDRVMVFCWWSDWISDVVLERDGTHGTDRLVPEDLRNNIASFYEYLTFCSSVIVYVSSFLGLHLAQGAYGDAADDRKTDPAKEKRDSESQDAGMKWRLNIYSGEWDRGV